MSDSIVGNVSAETPPSKKEIYRKNISERIRRKVSDYGGILEIPHERSFSVRIKDGTFPLWFRGAVVSDEGELALICESGSRIILLTEDKVPFKSFAKVSARLEKLDGLGLVSKSESWILFDNMLFCNWP